MNTPAVVGIRKKGVRLIRFAVIQDSTYNAIGTVGISLFEHKGIRCKIIMDFNFAGSIRI